VSNVEESESSEPGFFIFFFPFLEKKVIEALKNLKRLNKLKNRISS